MPSWRQPTSSTCGQHGSPGCDASAPHHVSAPSGSRSTCATIVVHCGRRPVSVHTSVASGSRVDRTMTMVRALIRHRPTARRRYLLSGLPHYRSPDDGSLGRLGPAILVLSGAGFPLTQVAIARFGRRGALLVQAVVVGLLMRDIVLIASGAPSRLRPGPAVLLWAEAAAAAAAATAPAPRSGGRECPPGRVGSPARRAVPSRGRRDPVRPAHGAVPYLPLARLWSTTADRPVRPLRQVGSVSGCHLIAKHGNGHRSGYSLAGIGADMGGSPS
jgi:hypothetical protein